MHQPLASRLKLIHYRQYKPRTTTSYVPRDCCCQPHHRRRHPRGQTGNRKSTSSEVKRGEMGTPIKPIKPSRRPTCGQNKAAVPSQLVAGGIETLRWPKHGQAKPVAEESRRYDGQNMARPSQSPENRDATMAKTRPSQPGLCRPNQRIPL